VLLPFASLPDIPQIVPAPKSSTMLKKFLLPALAALITLQLPAQDRISGPAGVTRSEVIGQHGMVATSHPLATQIGLDILKQGGTAVDAAIAANAALGLMEPTGSGIGGDLFAIVWDAKTQQLYGLNASGRSPQDLSLQWLKQNGYDKIPALGPLPVSVPGCVDGWFELHGKFGKLHMEDILAPAIRYAEEGFPVTELIAYYLQRSIPLYQSKGFPNIKETWTTEGKVPEKGDIFRNPALAATYRLLAKRGRDGFYKGEVAATIADFIKAQGGFLSRKDLAAHHSEWVEPVSTTYRGYQVWELPPNGQGIAALQMLNILEGYDFGQIPFGSAEHLHLFTEAKKLVFEDRARYYADPDFARIPVERLISKAYAAERRALIDPKKAGSYSAGEISKGETIYLCTADQYGNMVSLIQSNYRGMGSGMAPPGLGFMLQDRGELFSLTEGQNNTYAPGKRPFHTIIPAFVTKDGKPWLAFGVMGGDFQPMGHVQILMNLIDYGMNLQEAGDAPRFEHRGSSEPTGEPADGTGELRFETGISDATRLQLAYLGHRISNETGYYGGYQAIMWDAVRKVYFGASESRKDGQAAGY
jgi:gamma-glutamyltranspeptidase/glutathione hydrolase